MAVILGVPRRWLYPLWIFRLASVAPGVYWGCVCLARLWPEAQLLRAPAAARSSSSSWGSVAAWPLARRLALTEALLAPLWCGASAYLAFLFADCLMSRWLMRYSPFAALLRLATLDAVSLFAAAQVGALASSSSAASATVAVGGRGTGAGALLPAWVGVFCVRVTPHSPPFKLLSFLLLLFLRVRGKWFQEGPCVVFG